MYNSKDELMDDVAAATAAALVITWSANTPTPSNAQTIADGDLVAGTELGQAIANLTAIVNQLVIDVAAIRTGVNA